MARTPPPWRAPRAIRRWPSGCRPRPDRTAERLAPARRSPYGRAMGAEKPPLSVGIGGLGAIGLAVAKALDRGIPGLALKAVSARDRASAVTRIAGFKS